MDENQIKERIYDLNTAIASLVHVISVFEKDVLKYYDHTHTELAHTMHILMEEREKLYKKITFKIE